MQVSEALIRKSLSTLESDFFAALQLGSEALTSFHHAWTTFNSEVENCVEYLNTDTMLQIHSFAAVADIVTSSILAVRTAGDDIHHQFKEDITNIIREEFKELTIHDKTASSDSQRSAAYIPDSYKWLLNNLHNPYPNKETRLKIAQSTHSDAKLVDAWFIDARKRIGWNQLRKDHFPKRSDLIKAATLFFKGQPSTLSSLNNSELPAVESRYMEFANQFVQIEERARELFSTKFVPTTLASKLGGGGTCYPSPPGTSLSVSPPPSSPVCVPFNYNGDNTVKKRKRSASSTVSDMQSDAEQPDHNNYKIKRRRFTDSEIGGHEAAVSLPSPAASISSVDEAGSKFLPANPSPSSMTSFKRKRDAYDMDDRYVKRQNIVRSPISVSASTTLLDAASSQCHYSSDNFLSEFFLDNQQTLFNIPPPITEETLPESTKLDVEYYDHNLWVTHDSVDSRDSHDTCSTVGSPLGSDCSELPENLSVNAQLQDAWSDDIPSLSSSLQCADLPSIWDFGTGTGVTLPGPDLWQTILAANGGMLSSGYSDDYSITFDSLPVDALCQLASSGARDDYFNTYALPCVDAFACILPKTSVQLA